jgi:cell division protein FtsB
VKPAALKNAPVFRKKAFRLGIGLLFLVMIMTSVFGKRGFMEIRNEHRSLAGLEAKLAELQKQKLRLEAEIRQLKANPRAVEKEARRLGLIKPGEKVIMLPKAPDR